MTGEAATSPRARIGIGPAGPGYVLVIGLVVGLAVYAQINLLFWGVGLVLGGLVVSAILPVLMLSGVEAERMAPSHGVAGETTILRYKLVNPKGWLPVFGLVIRESWGPGRHGWRHAGPLAEDPPRLAGSPHGWVLHLGPTAQAHADAPCWPRRRGTLALEKVVLMSWFPFGPLRREVELDQPAHILVYPHIFRLARRLVVRTAAYDPLGAQQRERGGGNEEFFGLRPYRPGDSLKLIDWKHSARTGQLVSREMTQVAPPRLVVGLDLSDPSGEAVAPPPRRRSATEAETTSREPVMGATERAISLAASLICEGHLAGYQVGLVVFGADTVYPPHHSVAHRGRLLEALARLDAEEIRRRAAAGHKGATGVDPTVVVRLGGDDDTEGRRGPAILSAASMHKHVSDPTGGASHMLARRPGARAGRATPPPEEAA